VARTFKKKLFLKTLKTFLERFFMKQLLIIAICAILAAPAMAYQIAEEHKKILEPQVENFLKILADLEKDVVAKDQAFQAAETKRKEIEAKIEDPATGFFAKGKLKVDLALAKSSEKKALKALQNVKADMAVKQAVLAILDKRPMSEAELKAAKELIAVMETNQAGMTKKFTKLEKAYKKATTRLEQIPSEKVGAETMLKQHQARLDELNQNKTWGNLGERTKEKGLVEYEENKLSRLAKETVKLEKAVAEYNAFLVEKLALDNAILYIKDAKIEAPVTAQPVVEPDEPETPETPDEPEEDDGEEDKE